MSWLVMRVDAVFELCDFPATPRLLAAPHRWPDSFKTQHYPDKEGLQ
jgi:hypothetical protein